MSAVGFVYKGEKLHRRLVVAALGAFVVCIVVLFTHDAVVENDCSHSSIG